MKSFSIKKLTEIINGVLVGNKALQISGLEEINSAGKNQLTIIGNTKYLAYWKNSNASAAIIGEKLKLEPGAGRALIRVKNADLAMVKMLELFKPDLPWLNDGIHPLAVVHPKAKIGKNVSVGAGCYIGADVTIGKRTKLYPNVTVLDQTSIGKDTVIWSGTVIRERNQIGNNCIFHPNVTIGADGFGYHPSENGESLVKDQQIGNVNIGNEVEIGSGTCVDRGKYSSTKIGNGCKIDNLVQIAHNCILGRNCILAGNSGLAGSVTLGDGVVVAGSASIKDHVKIGNNAIIGGGSVVISNVSAGKKVLGYPATKYNDTLRRWAMVRRSIQN
jgi:UDP-3-O-[3-hydroxymyristoyl] glucosamine N-acyltransferase